MYAYGFCDESELDKRIALRKKTMLRSMPRREKGAIYVSHVVSPGDIWVQDFDDFQIIANVQKELERVVGDKEYLLCGPPVVGKLYAAKHPEQGWCRAKLLKLDKDIAEAFFVDHGDKQNLPVKWIRQLSQSHQNFPPMALRCKLSAVDLDIWPDSATQFMKTLCDEFFRGTIVFKSEEGPIYEVVSLYLKGDDGNRIDAVKEVLSCLEREHPVGASPQAIPQPLTSPESVPDWSASSECSTVFIGAAPQTESTKISQELNEDENRFPVD